ncbi:MAG: alanine racemase [Spirochaetes bacterium]|nr:alanine racemase [Spirochaetota bacterium]
MQNITNTSLFGNNSLSGFRRTHALIDLNAIKHNIIGIKEKVGNRMICPAVKADGYGHGAVEISRFLERENLADYFGVATVLEGIELRDAGIKKPILLLGLIMPDEVYDAVKYNLTITVAYKQKLEEILHACHILKKKAKIHIKVDTGMGRIGCKPEEVLEIASTIKNYPDLLILEGLFTHFPESDSKNKEFSYYQIKLFNEIIENLKKNNIEIPIKHMANSGAILDLPESYFDMVRPGVMTYGYYPSDETTESIKIKPSMSLKSQIIFIKRVKKGTTISYGRTYTVSKDSFIATVPAGYADGINRLLSNNHSVIINEKKYPIAGRVCMDQFCVDLGDDFYGIGTDVFIFDTKHFTASDMARKLKTIPYEVTCWVSKRVKRYYLL